VLQRNAQGWQSVEVGILCITQERKQQPQQHFSTMCIATEEQRLRPQHPLGPNRGAKAPDYSIYSTAFIIKLSCARRRCLCCRSQILASHAAHLHVLHATELAVAKI
jgi:hypothetical protein